MNSRFGWIAAFVAVPLMAGQAAASPILELSVAETGFTTQYVMSTPGTGLSFTGLYGGYNLIISGYGDGTGISFNVSVNSATGTINPLTVSLTETGLLATPSTVVEFTSQTSASLHSGSTLSTQSYYDAADTAFGQGGLLASHTINGPLFTGGTPSIVDVGIPAPYSVTKTATLSTLTSPSAAGQYSFSQLYISDIPEPASLALLTGSLGALVMLRRRRHGAASA